MRKGVVIFIAIVYAMILKAEQLKPNELEFVNCIKQYLSDEGYRPEIDDDQDVTFKKEGILYWVRVREESQGEYFFVSLNRNTVSCEDAKLFAIYKTVNEIVKEYKIGKVFYSDKNDNVSIRIEGFYSTASDFNKFFNRYMSILKGMHDDVLKYYKDFSE